MFNPEILIEIKFNIFIIDIFNFKTLFFNLKMFFERFKL